MSTCSSAYFKWTRGLARTDGHVGSDVDEYMMDDDELGEDAGDMDSQYATPKSNSPTKLTARQRARNNKDLQETLIALPGESIRQESKAIPDYAAESGSKKVILTEAERLQRREEVARRRKRQSEQKLQDEQVCLSALHFRSCSRFSHHLVGPNDQSIAASSDGKIESTIRCPLTSGRRRCRRVLTIRFTFKKNDSSTSRQHDPLGQLDRRRVSRPQGRRADGQGELD